MTSRRALLAALAFGGLASIGGAAAQPSSSRLVTGDSLSWLGGNNLPEDVRDAAPKSVCVM
jgi:hypothetical protein